MKLELKRVSIWSVVKISFMLYLVLGFLEGIFIAFFFAIAASLPMSGQEDVTGALHIFSGVMAIFIPFFAAIGAAVFGSIFGAIAAIVYNLFAKMVGGLEFEFKQVVEATPVTVQAGFAPPASGGGQQETI